MYTMIVDFNLAMGIRQDVDAGVFVGYCPALGVYSQGRTEKEAEDATKSAAALFIGVCYERGKLHTLLTQRGMIRASVPAKVEENSEYIKVIPGFERVVTHRVPVELFSNSEAEVCH